MKKIFKYTSFEDDIITSHNQKYQLNDNYKWIHKNIIYVGLSYILYYIVLLIAFVYCKLFKRIKYIGKKNIKDKSYFLYANHTLTVGDVLNPFLICFPKRPYLICSPANMGIPVIGKLLPMLGALPIPDKISQYKAFLEAITVRSRNNPIIIYPEAHLWPYYTKIRPFGTSAFHYPVDMQKKVYTATTTFQNKKIIIYLNGSYSTDINITRKENIKKIHDLVYDSMCNKAKLSNSEKYTYINEKEVI